MTAWELFPLKLTDVKICTRQLDLFTLFVDDHRFVEYYLVRTEKSASVGDFNHASPN